MKFRKDTAFWCSIFVFSFLACYKLSGSDKAGNRGGFLKSTLFPFLTSFFGALSLAVFYLMVRLCKTKYARLSFRDIFSAWFFSGSTVAGWGFIRMFIKKQPYRYSSLCGALFAAIALFILWKFSDSETEKQAEAPADRED